MVERRAARLQGRAVLALSGAGTAEFLQGIVSNDVRLLGPGRPLYAALLTAQGKYLFDFILHDGGRLHDGGGPPDGGGTVLVDAEAARLGELQQRLAMYRLRAKVTIAPAPGLAVLALWGGERVADDAALVADDPRLPALGQRALLPAAALPAFVERHGLGLVDEDSYAAHRLTLGVPEGSRDLAVGRALLLESNFEDLRGVSFDKGCFVGQELTARTKHRGLVRKRLVPVRIEGQAEPEAVLRGGENGEADAGELRAVYGERGLALVRLPFLRAPVLRAGEALVRPELPPWLAAVADEGGKA